MVGGITSEDPTESWDLHLLSQIAKHDTEIIVPCHQVSLGVIAPEHTTFDAANGIGLGEHTIPEVRAHGL
jgi:hypothetical protein